MGIGMMLRCDNTVWGSASNVAANGSLPLLLTCGGLNLGTGESIWSRLI